MAFTFGRTILDSVAREKDREMQRSRDELNKRLIDRQIARLSQAMDFAAQAQPGILEKQGLDITALELGNTQTQQVVDFHEYTKEAGASKIFSDADLAGSQAELADDELNEFRRRAKVLSRTVNLGEQGGVDFGDVEYQDALSALPSLVYRDTASIQAGADDLSNVDLSLATDIAQYERSGGAGEAPFLDEPNSLYYRGPAGREDVQRSLEILRGEDRRTIGTQSAVESGVARKKSIDSRDISSSLDLLGEQVKAARRLSRDPAEVNNFAEMSLFFEGASKKLVDLERASRGAIRTFYPQGLMSRVAPNPFPNLAKNASTEGLTDDQARTEELARKSRVKDLRNQIRTLEDQFLSTHRGTLQQLAGQNQEQ